MKVGVVAHQRKTLDGGLDELRRCIADHVSGDVLWCEVPKSRKAPKAVRRVLDDGADLVLVWGGDGTVQRCVDVVAGTGVPVAIVPTGTANLLASNLGIPADIAEAVHIAFEGAQRKLDLGVLNGEHFAVMAGTGFDALMIRDADRGMKDRLGRLAYVKTGWRHLDGSSTETRIRIDGTDWFEGEASCVLLGNVGTITGGLKPFADARPDDGWLEVGVATAKGKLQWLRTLGRMAVGRAERSPFVRRTRAREIDVKLGRKLPYELDGGDRSTTKRLRARVEPATITLCVPSEEAA
jgi:YegS/Rv2252/BmrU family lipid kinase